MKESKSKQTQRLLTICLIWLAVLFLINTFFSSLMSAIKDVSYIESEENKLTQLLEKKQKAEDELKYRQSQVYLSIRALNDLGYSDPSAKIFFIKDDSENLENTVELKTELLFPEKKPVGKTNFEKWLEIYLE